MTYGHKAVLAQLHRRGSEADVLVKSETGANDFGNVTHSYTYDRTVIAAKTYPNRNTTIDSGVGDRDQDRPVFMVPIGPDQPDPPNPEDHINYDGQEYEVKSHTPYDTHVEFFGAPVIHE